MTSKSVLIPFHQCPQIVSNLTQPLNLSDLLGTYYDLAHTSNLYQDDTKFKCGLWQFQNDDCDPDLFRVNYSDIFNLTNFYLRTESTYCGIGKLERGANLHNAGHGHLKIAYGPELYERLRYRVNNIEAFADFRKFSNRLHSQNGNYQILSIQEDDLLGEILFVYSCRDNCGQNFCASSWPRFWILSKKLPLTKNLDPEMFKKYQQRLSDKIEEILKFYHTKNKSRAANDRLLRNFKIVDHNSCDYSKFVNSEFPDLSENCSSLRQACVCYDYADYFGIEKSNLSAKNSELCYSSSQPYGGTLDRPIPALPDSPAMIQPEFRLSFQNSYELLNLSTKSPNFNPNLPTKILIHGFMSNGDENSWCVEVKNSILEISNQEFNVIIVDWSEGANVGKFFDIYYPKAAQNTRIVGDLLGIFLAEFLKRHYFESFNQVSEYLSTQTHCIGHSLGAHTCGYFGKILQENYATQLFRITGLDPAGPYFRNTEPALKLDKTDAKYVDSIHTDAETLLELGFGMSNSDSHFDFYPNGGLNQPGCGSLSIGCSHGKATEYYNLSILDSRSSSLASKYSARKCGDRTKFRDQKCDNKYAILGWNLDFLQAVEGKYFLNFIA